ncbi:tRNA 4-thiouridine(8) synthase ThiI [Anaerosalibacter bizertensis]|uniref:Probable tRNA sulfurtransferase n=1 Tax=Anaerosalibacter bizertensis TaxID=932217 RepID=A0A844FKL0_9FIRM|nr:tRNA uracil 4-sulfurtransferase ThiI [Anaerosalibacter bizertensis]MBV1818622.1 tRNA 4-thiouridine(8) synthase ThiI [Bacteroidales bacterium MSK.15.36]MBU5294747.1 tRNA 4-thiouridine(8) synthase ThiI [Anaerosalibacter bizertensis]MCB5558691.1 tRNA 4-thiouridine(8) synthase ThiI [Anaerosalibacter bizertensis]MCG4565727.1 tRNA 4-thiouridine(8) synthase ThiI [Anaerosalibacter bizertensis]MCG4582738.1 tRNA 4-thiouridine(8) synthase ThiI [Anaerosalibacter bizertensis]
MDKVISVSLGEVALKGLNRGYFERKLVKQIKNATKDLGAPKIYKNQGKIYLEAEEIYFDQIISRLKKIFGIVYISPCIKVEKDIESIEQGAINAFKEVLEQKDIKTFKVKTKRVDKDYPIKSPDVSRRIGAIILDNFPNVKVDVHNPEVYLYIDIKDSCYIYIERIKAYGGLPIGTNGEGLLLLSGGIDSPVAGFMMAKRGVKLNALHFHSYPFTSERAEEKVKNLASIMARYCGNIPFYSINILNIQKEINKKCPEDEMTILSRRFMMRIAEKIAKDKNINALITGENLGQVASQTIQGIQVINSSVEMPILRPLIGFDKVQIIDISKEIETYETSILPYEDCCTVFLPKHPVTKPKLEDIEESEKNLDIDYLVDKAIQNMEYSIIKAK